MIPLRIDQQTVITRSSWKEMMERVKEMWDQDHYITDFDYGNGVYRVVMSSGTGWNGQAIRVGKTFPENEVDELWNKGYNITNVTHDGQDWIVIMSGNTGLSRQRWFTRNSWESFKQAISQGWEDGKVITKIAYGNGTYCGIMSSGLNWSQTWKFIPGEITQQHLNELYEDGDKIVTEVFDIDGGMFIVLSGNTGYDDQFISQSSNWDRLSERLTEYWNKNYNVTTIGYYNGDWFLLMSR